MNETSQASGRTRGSAWRVAGFVVALIPLAILGYVLHQSWQGLPEEMLVPAWDRVALGVALQWASAAGCALQWRAILGALGMRLSPAEALHIHFYSQVGKYLPGKALLVVGKVVLATRQGLPLRGVTASVVYDQVLFLLSGAVTALILATVASADVIGRYRPLVLAVCVAGMALLHPAVIGRIFEIVRRVSRTELALPSLPYRTTLRLLATYAVPWLVAGIGFYFFVSAFVELVPRALPDMAAVVIASVIIGFIAVFAPAGIGVREAALSGLLALYFALPVAVAVAFAYRVAATAVDAASAVVALALSPAARRHAAARSNADERPT